MPNDSHDDLLTRFLTPRRGSRRSSVAPPLPLSDADTSIEERAVNASVAEAAAAVDVEIDAARCPLCRHEVWGVTSGACPECGARFRLGLVMHEREVFAPPIWLAAVITLALATGFSAFPTIASVWTWVAFGDWMLLLMGSPTLYHAGLVVSLPGLIIMILARQRFRRLPRERQMQYGTVAITIAIIAMTVQFVEWIRLVM